MSEYKPSAKYRYSAGQDPMTYSKYQMPKP